MQAIDEIGRIKRDGSLTYFRSTRQSGSPDQQVIESVSVTLRTPDDPLGKCVAHVEVEWVPHFANAALAPRLNSEGGNLKMLALFPEILSPFFAMDHGELSPDAFVEGLLKIGVRPDDGNASYKPLACVCSQCDSLFAPEVCKDGICTYCEISHNIAVRLSALAYRKSAAPRCPSRPLAGTRKCDEYPCWLLAIQRRPFLMPLVIHRRRIASWAVSIGMCLGFGGMSTAVLTLHI